MGNPWAHGKQRPTEADHRAAHPDGDTRTETAGLDAGGEAIENGRTPLRLPPSAIRR